MVNCKLIGEYTGIGVKVLHWKYLHWKYLHWKYLHWKYLHWKYLHWKYLHWKYLHWKYLHWKYLHIKSIYIENIYIESIYVESIAALSGRISKVVASHAEGCKIESRLWLSFTDLYYARGAQEYCPWGWGIRLVNWLHRLWRHCPSLVVVNSN